MMKRIALLLLTISLSALGQSNSTYNATTYAYTTQVTTGNAATGSSSIVAVPTAFAQGIPFLPYNTNASITINRNAATAETVTPGPIANCFPNSLTCTLSAVFTFKHIAGESIQSGTFGLQEAINVASASGAGTVLIDATWGGPSGTSLITAAKGSTTVVVQDNRNPTGPVFYQWNGTNYVATGSGGAVSSVFGRTGAVTAQSGDYACSQVTGCPTAAITSINGDTTAAQQFKASGTGLSVATSSGVTTYTLAGGGLTGTITSSALGQMTFFPGAGTNVAGVPNMYTINSGWTQAQINTLTSGLSGQNTIFIPAGAPQIGYTVNGQVPHDFRLNADWFQMPGVACDGKQSALGITITSGSNTSSVGALLGTADAGKTFFFFNRTGYGFGSTQSVWTPTLVSVVSSTATWSSNAPFSQTSQVYYGTDNLAAINLAMTQASSTFPITIPTGCQLLVNGTIPWNNNQVIVGRHAGSGGFIGAPAMDIIASTDTSGQSVSASGTGLKGFQMIPSTETDWTLGYNLYSANGTLTVVPPVYRPLYPHTPLANDPLAPGWITGKAKNGVASTTQNSAVICTPSAMTAPVVSTAIVFPYGPKVFTSTVSSTAGSCSGGATPRTMAAALPNVSGYTVTQNEWFTGTSVQTTTTTLPGTPSYPFTIQLSNSIKPIPGWPSNVAQEGHAKIQDYEFDYMGINFLTNTMVIRKGPATINAGAGYSGTNTIVPLNRCPAKFDTPWPVTPTINSGDSTPSGATYFPGECGGNFAIAFPQANGNVYAGTGLAGGFISDIDFVGSAAPGASSANANNTGAILVQGNNAPFSSHHENLISSNLQYGYVQGPASYGMHGVAAVGPTGIGNVFRNLWFFGAFDLSFVDFQGSTVDEMNMNSVEVSPFDGTNVGSSTCISAWFTLDEQTGGVVTTSQYDHFNTYACEPEAGSHIVLNPAVMLWGSFLNGDTMNFEGVPNVFGGDHLHLTNSRVALPAIDYGSNNDFGIVGNDTSGYITNVWDTNTQFLFWGSHAVCSAWAGGIGPPRACGASTVHGYDGRDIGPSMTGNAVPYFTEAGKITPWMWDNNGAFDSSPFTTTGTSDPTAPFWGSSATCALGGAAQCQTKNFYQSNTGFIYIGPWNQIAPMGYSLDATFKSVSASSSFLLTIFASDPGTGTCTAGFTQLFQGTVNTTTSFTPFAADINFAGFSGCTLEVQLGTGSTSDTIVVDRFNFVPRPGFVRGPVSAPTYPGSCPAGVPPSAWLGSFSGFAYFCDGTAVHRVGIS